MDDMYKAYFDSMPCYLSVQDRELKIVEANERFVKNFGDPTGHYTGAGPLESRNVGLRVMMFNNRNPRNRQRPPKGIWNRRKPKKEFGSWNAECGKQETAPAVVTLGRDYGSAGRAYACDLV